MSFFNWSRISNNNANADPTINWSEGQAPSSINDSARAMMAATAAYRDDIAGAIVTGGTSTAYIVSSFEVFDTLAHMNGMVLAFSPHATNGAGPVTLNVDGLGSKPLRSAPNADLQAGVLIQGTPYVATYSNSDGAWYLQGFYGNPFNLPLGGMIDFIGTTAPNSSFVLPFGQAISRTTYATLFAMVGTTYGVGDGSTTFNVPDCRGRVVAGGDGMGGTPANRLTSGGSGITGTTLGATGGAETETLTLAQLPTGITVTGSASLNSTGQFNSGGIVTVTVGSGGSTVNAFNLAGGGLSPVTSTGTVNLTSNNTSGNAHVNAQPTIVCNKILRII